MKRFLYIILAAIATFVSCNTFDYESILEQLRDHEERIQKLEALCNRLNSNVEAVQTILTAMEQNDYVTDIVKVVEDGVEVGYSITFAKGGTVTIYHGTDGTDGSAPKVSIRKAQDGEYYWTADGEWMTDENGEKIPAVVADDPDGEYVTPQFRVAEGKWYISYDGGNSWKEIEVPGGNNTGDASFFLDVTADSENLYLTLADGTKLTIPTNLHTTVSMTLTSDHFINGTYSGDNLTTTQKNRIRTGLIYANRGDSCVIDLEDGWSGYIGIQNSPSYIVATDWVQRIEYEFLYDCNFIVVLRKDDNSNIAPSDFDSIVRINSRKISGNDNQVKSYFQKEIDETIASIKEVLTEPYLMFAMISDIHYMSSSELPNSISNTTDNICELSKSLKMDFIANLGDNVDGNTPQITTEAYCDYILSQFDKTGIPYYPCIGNHDDNRYCPPAFTHSQLYFNYLRNTKGVFWDNQTSMCGTNYYRDFEELGIRCIFLNANTNGNYGYSNDTCEWFEDVLDTAPGQYIVFTHIAPIPSLNYGLTQYGNDEGSARIRRKCTETSDKLIAMFSGHNHYDAYVTDPFLCVTVNSHKFENENGDPGLWKEGAVKPSRKIGDATEDCFDIVIVRPRSKKINRIRFGAGTDETYDFSNVIPAPQPEPEDPEESQSIKVLAIGNSFSVDAMEYLYGMLEDVGYEEIVLGNLYIGGCTLETHASNFTADKGAYTYYLNTTGSWTSTSSYKPLTALDSEDWDYITMQQASPKSGQPDTYDPYMTTVIDIVKEHKPDADLVWHMTWAYQGNSTHTGFANYSNDQMTMYNAIVDAVQSKILTNSNFINIIPSGTAVQNMRTSFVGDNLTRDGYHMSYDKGRYLTALCYAKALTGCDLSQVNYTPSAYTFSSSLLDAMKEAVNNAVAQPFEVTASTFGKDPDKVDYSTATMEEILAHSGYNVSDYSKLEIGFTKFAYYNSSNELMKSTLHTAYNQDIHSHPNYIKYVGTEILERYDIPVGSVIIIKADCKYRPEGWVDLDVPNGTGSGYSGISRPGNVTTNVVEVTEEWWGSFNYRAFNLSYATEVALNDTTADKLISNFAIFVPSRH